MGQKRIASGEGLSLARPEGEGKVQSLADMKNDNLDHTLKLYGAEESLRDLIKMQILNQQV